MREYTSFRAGGTADILAFPPDEDALVAALAFLAEAGLPCLVTGNGSNLLVRDGGFRGVIVRIGKPVGRIDVDGCGISVQAGALLSELAEAAAAASLTGLEFAGGIPGSLGGAICMNAGAYGGEMRQVVETARVYAPGAPGAGVAEIGRDALRLSYRSSALQENGGVVVLGAKLRLAPGEPSEIRGRMAEFARRRAEKQPLGLPSAGSFFKRPQGHFAGKLIQDAGLAGLIFGGAQISGMHAGFIVNRGGATAADIIGLMETAQAAVMDRFGVLLEPEVRIVGEI
jgi:UDP-N-acetylmuramate dehydrogenase